MGTTNKTDITIETTVNASPEKVWKYWTEPDHITQWNAASDDWHSPSASNDLKIGGKFTSRMEAKDGSAGFDFGGKYTKVKAPEHLAYTMDDDRKVEVSFEKRGDKTHVTETFEAESQNPVEMQRNGWQAILDNFKKYTENH